MRRLWWIVLASVIGAGCGQVYVPLPAQRPEQRHAIREVLEMAEGRPENTWGGVDSGIAPGSATGADWRWATEHSAFHFKLDEFSGWSFAARITAVKAVLDRVGSQRVTFRVNGSVVGSADLKVSQDYNFSIPLDEALLKGQAPVAVTMDAGPCLPQQYGPPYCVLLHEVGFVKQVQP
jgi:hypothetical protein